MNDATEAAPGRSFDDVAGALLRKCRENLDMPADAAHAAADPEDAEPDVVKFGKTTRRSFESIDPLRKPIDARLEPKPPTLAHLTARALSKPNCGAYAAAVAGLASIVAAFEGVHYGDAKKARDLAFETLAEIAADVDAPPRR